MIGASYRERLAQIGDRQPEGPPVPGRGYCTLYAGMRIGVTDLCSRWDRSTRWSRCECSTGPIKQVDDKILAVGGTKRVECQVSVRVMG
ncbi:MAG: hypothetical protein OEX80_07210, partial [Candidatus Aminicenantes bacterium]|nr:hypothetical protein [Candidatus Aminicenantes bacterium]